MNNKNQKDANIEIVSEQEMLNLFQVEELENRLEMASISASEIEAADGGNKICWLA
ncbi:MULTISPECIES: hypothetical protein [Flavobacterium]|uniref:Bacteriocin n=1 Tax=Flavobacterium hankyongi TaxID=1176532 RepID=A0ABP8ZJE9_9FLAO|nr:hypothetical protein [Flavobacterium sp. N1846]